jgi:hypothetical protein
VVKTIKSKAPSRVKYEKTHPTVSCRVPRDVYDKLKAFIDSEGKSFADVLKTGLGIMKAQVKEEEDIRIKGYDEGYRKGYEDAERLYKITYPCSVCGRTITLTSANEKEAVKKYMQEHSWGHNSCHERKQ